VLACNTIHVKISEIQALTHIPIMDIIGETVKYIQEKIES